MHPKFSEIISNLYSYLRFYLSVYPFYALIPSHDLSLFLKSTPPKKKKKIVGLPRVTRFSILKYGTLLDLDFRGQETIVKFRASAASEQKL